ncbi:DUF4179 domain-containing protein [Alicyclobacillus sp.]|uniref:DUF4179 domain-containing protein n=1 Tax=Alicyclobacillus sp. TaxID=61169 RepID=UPI0025BC1FE4|nr:DUF4179 domain-containing protein [Alicyclobacillus sp.]MCL6517817.1 DUF4179 domain-containing protein [Alicyclobacillus sp.]
MDGLERQLERSRERTFRHELRLPGKGVRAVQASAGWNRRTLGLGGWRRRVTRVRRRRLGLAGIAAAGVLLACGFAAPQLIHLGREFNLLGSSFSPPDVRNPVLEGYGQKVNQSVTSHGITLTIGNVYADAVRFEFDLVESFTPGAPSKPVIRDQDIQIDVNGRPIRGFSGGEFQPTDDGRYAGVVFEPMQNEQPFWLLPEDFTLHVHVGRIGDVAGTWDFSIPVSRSRMAAATRVLHPNVQKQAGGVSFAVDEVDVEPDETLVFASVTSPPGVRQMPGMAFDLGGIRSVRVMDDQGHLLGRTILGWMEEGQGSGQSGVSQQGAPGVDERGTASEAATRARYRLVIAADKLPQHARSLTVVPTGWEMASIPLGTGAGGGGVIGRGAAGWGDVARLPVSVDGVQVLSDRTLVHVRVSGPATSWEIAGQPLLDFSLVELSRGREIPRQGMQPDADGKGWQLAFAKVDAGASLALDVLWEPPLDGLTVDVPVASGAVNG